MELIRRYATASNFVSGGIVVTTGSQVIGIAIVPIAHYAGVKCRWGQHLPTHSGQRVHQGSLVPLCLGSALLFYGLYRHCNPADRGAGGLLALSTFSAAGGVTLFAGLIFDPERPAGQWAYVGGLMWAILIAPVGWLAAGVTAVYKMGSTYGAVGGWGTIAAWLGLGGGYLGYAFKFTNMEGCPG
jgi:hypothetical protein